MITDVVCLDVFGLKFEIRLIASFTLFFKKVKISGFCARGMYRLQHKSKKLLTPDLTFTANIKNEAEN